MKPYQIAALALTVVCSSATSATAQKLSSAERRIAQYVDQHNNEALALLEQIVNINSGTFNRDGQRRVAEALTPAFRELGFAVRYSTLPDSLARGGHLIAERKGKRGRKLLLIGHLDTVFEEDSPFQRFKRIDDSTAAGPGVSDMKGGDVAMLQALRALHSVGALDNTTITVVLTGDEERPGRPLSVSRHDLIEAAKASDIALAFEGLVTDSLGDLGTIARRSSSSWTLRVKGNPAHSSGVFGRNAGAGAIYEGARILDTFYNELRGEENLTFNPGIIVGGTNALLNDDATGTASGKTNVVAAEVIVQGDIRTLTDEQLQRTRERMREIVKRSLPRTSADITFADGYPSMPPTAASGQVLKLYDEVSRALGYGAVRELEPNRRGGGDISFVAAYIPGLDGIGVDGSGSHTVDETIDLRTLPKQSKRAAILMYRLLRQK